jgi:DNA invertase Pin-like site-specific DNA recombinase
MQAVARREIDLVMAWSVDRLGRSLQDLIGLLGELHGKRVDLYLHQQGLDTSTPAGKALFQMMGVFAECERAMIRERVNAGLARAKAEGKRLGRPRNDDAKQRVTVARLRKQGVGILKIAREVGTGTSYVQRLVAELEAAAT